MDRVKTIHQMLPGLRCGDAVSNQALWMQRLLREWGYISEIYAVPDNCDPLMQVHCRAYQTHTSQPGQIVIYHHCIGSEVADFARDLPDRVIMYYHNITPPEFMEVIDPRLARGLSWGREQLAYFARRPYALAGSDYNRQELLAHGYLQVDILPYFIRFEALDTNIESEAGRAVLSRYGDGCANWLFVGRVSPNKCQTDLIRMLAYYQRWLDPSARLLLPGSSADTPGYHLELERLARRLAVNNVELCGHVPDDVLSAYYRVASVYISMSEHEGFGIPLLEAMHMGVPVLAYAAAAVPDTLAGAGILFHRKRFDALAELAHLLVTDECVRARVLARQRARLADLAPEQVARQLRAVVDGLEKVP